MADHCKHAALSAIAKRPAALLRKQSSWIGGGLAMMAVRSACILVPLGVAYGSVVANHSKDVAARKVARLAALAASRRPAGWLI